MTKLVLIRHGITEWNRQKRYCGHKDIGLSAEGRFQARLLSKRLGAARFDKIYCSDRKRAIETARILFKKADIVPKAGLREMNFGVLEGLRHKEIMKKYADIYGKWLKDSFKNNIPEAEPMDAFKGRVERALTSIAGSNPGRTVAVVCHGGVIAIFLTGISKNRDFWSCVPSPASITTVEYEKNERPKVKKFNDTAHLEVNDE
jgi:broad specificity phosphatase PhoE